MKRRTGLFGVITRHWAPQHGGVDLARGQILDHRHCGRVDARIDHQRIRLRIHHQAVHRHIGRGRRAGDDADMLVLETGVLKRCNVVEAATRLCDQRVGRPVVRIGALHEIVALRKTHDDVAAVRAQRHLDEAGRLREIHIVEPLLQLGSEQLGELVLKALAFLV